MKKTNALAVLTLCIASFLLLLTSPSADAAIQLAGEQSCFGELVVIDASQEQPSGDPLQDWIDENYSAKTSRALGMSGSNNYFGRTFDLPDNVNITGAWLTTEISRGGSNDSIGIGSNFPDNDRWGARLTAAGITSSKTEITVSLMNPPAYGNNTGTDMFGNAITHGSIDVVVQDDSTVHTMTLTLCIE